MDIPVKIKNLEIDNPPHASRWHRYYGFMHVALSALCFSILSIFVKLESKVLPILEIVFWRSIVAFFFNMVSLIWNKIRPLDQRKHLKWLFMRSIAGSLAMGCGFFSLTQMVLADSSALVFTSPLFTFLLGAIFLGEKIRRFDIACAFICLCGVVMVSRPTFLFENVDKTGKSSGNRMLGIIFAFSSAFFQAVAYVSVRKLKEVPFLLIINYFMVTAAILSLTGTILYNHTIILFQTSEIIWFYALMSGIMGFLGQIFLTKGFQIEKAGPASVLRFLDIAFVFVWDGLILHEKIQTWSILGAFSIVIGALVLTLSRKNSA